MIGIAVTGGAEVVKRLEKAGQDLVDMMREDMERATKLIESDLREKSLTGPKRIDPFWGVMGAEGEALAVRSGATRASIVSRTFRQGSTIVGVVGSPARHLKVLEEGGVVSATGKMLAIPTANAQTPGGSVKDEFRRDLRTVPGLFVIRSKTGRPWLARREGGETELLFLLKDSVTLKAHHAFRASARRMTPRVEALLGSGIGVVVRKANG